MAARGDDVLAAIPGLACAACRGQLRAEGDDLVCERCGARHAVRDGAVWTPGAAAPAEETGGGPLARLAQRAAANPRVYDLVQRAVGTPETRARVGAALADAGGRTVLDVGAGTGKARAFVPRDARYVWLDADPAKLRGFRVKWPGEPAVVADATRLPFGDGSLDHAVSIALAHHLDDEACDRVLTELARVVRDRLVLMDFVASSRPASRLLWRYDRGARARSEEELVGLVARRFEVERVERYARLHAYVLVVARLRG